MHIHISGTQLGAGRGRGLPCPDFVKNALTMSIFKLNFPFKM